MKKFYSVLSLLLALLCVFTTISLVSCKEQEELTAQELDELWKSAIYTENTELGNGSKTVQVEVKTDSRSVTITLHTDKETLADALLEHGLVGGDLSEYGLYIKKVNGITADYNVDQTYWAISKNGSLTETGASGVMIADGDHYELTRTVSSW